MGVTGRGPVNGYQNAEIGIAWLEYLGRFPHQNAFFRAASQYTYQAPVINGKKAITDINFYKLFVEQCYNLLRVGGQCGIVLPSGIYTDLGTKQLRELLFTKTEISGLFGLENRKEVFEGIHRSFKIAVLSFEKGSRTEFFPSAFMRLDVAELNDFPQYGALPLSVDLVRRLSPDSLSVMEFKNLVDVEIAEKMLRFPLLSEKISNTWNLSLSRELHMTDDSQLFNTSLTPERLPLYEGKMIWQFTHQLAVPKYWLNESEGRKALLGRTQDAGQELGYQRYRMGYRTVASNTNERTMIATILPSMAFSGHSINVISQALAAHYTLFVTALLNSFVIDFSLRQRVSVNLTIFYINQLPVPRLTERDPQFAPIVERAARLICTTPEFDDLAREVGLGSHANGVTDPAERVKLRAELDGLIGHLYGLDEAEFAHILSTFPLVATAIKDATLQAYRAFALNPDDEQVARLIAGGEVDRVEFKVGAAWNSHRKARDDTMRDNILQAVAAFMNSDEGGALLIGVADNGTVLGLADDYQTANSRKPNRDGYALFLSDLLGSRLGRENDSFYQISFHQVAGVEICRINVDPATKPVYIDQKDFYVRGGNKKNKLSAREAIEYVKQRWGH